MSAQGRGWGPGWPTDRNDDIVEVNLGGVGAPQGVHHRIAELVEIIAEACAADGFEFVDGWCWGYANRAISGTSVPSNHSWGLAVDINAPHNPYTEPWDQPAGEHAIPDWVGATFEHYGFRWGGPAYGDWMHMEFMGTSDDADRMTEKARAEHGRPPGDAPKPDIPEPDDGLTWIDMGGLMDGGVPLLREGYGYPDTGARGRTHWYVLTLQGALNLRALPGEPLTEDGLFGPATEAKVKALQERWDLLVDGIVGEQTWPWVLGNDAPDYA